MLLETWGGRNPDATLHKRQVMGSAPATAGFGDGGVGGLLSPEETLLPEGLLGLDREAEPYCHLRMHTQPASSVCMRMYSAHCAASATREQRLE